MPDPQTIRGAALATTPDNPTDRELDIVKRTTFDRYGDYHIIPGAKCVVTEQGLEAAAKALYLNAGKIEGNPAKQELWKAMPHDRRQLWINHTAVALEAAGIVFADEEGYVVQADEGEDGLRIEGLDFELGDRVFLVRGEVPVASAGSC